MTIEKEIRRLARSSYYQELYKASQDCSGIYLFDNQSNFTRQQYTFLYWLRVYSMLYNELYSMEWKNLDKKVIENDDRCDAFLFWRSKQQEKKIRKYQKDERKNQPKQQNMMKVFTGATNDKEGNK